MKKTNKQPDSLFEKMAAITRPVNLDEVVGNNKPKMIYKVECLLNDVADYPETLEEAEETFKLFKNNYGDEIRLYESPTPINDHDAPEWETIDYYDNDDDDEALKEDVQGHTPGEWELRHSTRGGYFFIDTVEAGEGITVTKLDCDEVTGQRIVQAVNNFDEMKEALQAMQEMFIHKDGEKRGNQSRTDMIKYNENVKNALNKTSTILNKLT